MSRLAPLPHTNERLERTWVSLDGFGPVLVAHLRPVFPASFLSEAPATSSAPSRSPRPGKPVPASRPLTETTPITPAGRTRPVVVVLPGLRGSDQGLARCLAPLGTPEGGSWEVFVINPSGMGISPAHPGVSYDFATQVRLVLRFLEQLSRPVILVGHSYGSVLASAVGAQWERERQAQPVSDTELAGLVLLSPIPRAAGAGTDLPNRAGTWGLRLYCRVLEAVARATDLDKMKTRPWHTGLLNTGLLRTVLLGAVQRFLDRDSRGWASNLWLSRYGWAGWRAIVRGSREKQLQHADLRAVAATHRASISTDCLRFAPHIRVPTAIIAGNADHLATRENLEQLRGELRGELRGALRTGLHGELRSPSAGAKTASRNACTTPPRAANQTGAGRGPLRVTIWLPGGGHLIHHEAAPQVAHALALALASLGKKRSALL